MQRNYDNYNYWQIDPYELPTRGLMYPKDAKIKIRSMTVLEVKFLATLLPQTATTVCNELLEKCTILENLKYEDLYLPDRAFLIFWIRLNSFTSKTGYTINIPKCSGCGQPIEENITLESLKFKHLEKPFIDHVYLPDTKAELKISIPKYKDSYIIPQDEIEEVAMYIVDDSMTFEQKVDFITNISAYDYITIKSIIDENYCGIKSEYIIVCDNCHKAHSVPLTVNDNNLFTSINLMEILEMITRIAKYTNVQITNDWTWVEVEVENAIVDKMMQEENEKNKSEINRAKQQAHSVNVPSVPSVPHF